MLENQPPKPFELVISRKTSLADLASRHITTLEQLAALPVEEIQSIVGIGKKTAPQVKALARAYMEDKAIRFGDLPHGLEQGSFLDIRVNPDTHPQQPWGFCLMTPDREKIRLLVIPGILPSRLHMDDGRVISLVPDTKSAWKQLVNAVDEYQSPVYYWNKNILGHINETAPKESRHRLLTRIADLSKVFLSVAAVPTKNDGLHKVATYMRVGHEPIGINLSNFRSNFVAD